MYCISQYLYQRYSTNLFFRVISIAQLVGVTDNAALGGVAEVLSSNPTVGHKNIFSAFTSRVDIYIYIYIYIYIERERERERESVTLHTCIWSICYLRVSPLGFIRCLQNFSFII